MGLGELKNKYLTMKIELISFQVDAKQRNESVFVYGAAAR